MPDHPLVEQLRNWGEGIAREYERAAAKGGRNSPSDIADFRESIVSKFVATFFPFPFRMAKGVIRDSHGKDSASTDVILLSPIHPYTSNESSKACLILADGVEAAIEVKSDCNNSSEIEIAMAQVVKAKQLRRVNHSLLATTRVAGQPLSGDKRRVFEDYWREVPAFIFFEKAAPSPESALLKIAAALENIPMRHRPDAIILNGGGIIVVEKLGHHFGYSEPGVYFESWGHLTLAGFLLFLNMVPSASLRMQEPFLKSYLAPLRAALPKKKLLFRRHEA